ncbi:MAG: ATP-binding protein [Bacilli bacterium]|nr:ATP-binding protein [Bacilli bacterium]
MIERNKYLGQLIKAAGNGFPKVITGIRRCGKSYLLKEIYKKHLLESGVDEGHFILIELDDNVNAKLRNPLELSRCVREKVFGRDGVFYIVLDEIQRVFDIVNPELTDGEIVLAKKEDKEIISFVDVVMGLSSLPNVDLYVTGSNSKLLSKDIVTQFRDKATQIHMAPLSFAEYYNYIGGSKTEAFYEYLLHGGMPLAVLSDRKQKEAYLEGLFATTYFKDILEHHGFQKQWALDDLADSLSSMVGKVINPERIANTLKSEGKTSLDPKTVQAYIDAFVDAFLLCGAPRYDVKGRSLIGAGKKYYFADTGLRNARLRFAFPDLGQLMENVVFNELLYRGYQVSIGVLPTVGKDPSGKSVRKDYEIDFIARKGYDALYIQIAQSVANPDVLKKELRPFDFVRGEAKNVLVVGDPVPETRNPDGTYLVGVADFLLNLE